MKVNLDNQNNDLSTLRKGDVVVFKNLISNKEHFYLVVRDAKDDLFRLVNLEANNIMANCSGVTPSIAVERLEFQMDFVDIIRKNDMKLSIIEH